MQSALSLLPGDLFSDSQCEHLQPVWGIDSEYAGLSFTELKMLHACPIFLKHCSHTVAITFIV